VRASWFFVSSVAVAALGCGGVATSAGATSNGGAGAGGGSPAPSVPPANFANAVAHAICDNMAGCCGKNAAAYSEAQCVAGIMAAYQKPTDTRYDPQAGGTCVQQAAEVASDCTADASKVASWETACASAFVGTKAPGQPCQNSQQCAPPSEGVAVCDEKCEAITRGRAGDPCRETCFESGGALASCTDFQTGAACFTSDGLYCSSQGACAPLAGLGQNCTDGNDCASGTYCDGAPGKCAPDVPIGGNCGDGETCVSGANCNDAGQCFATLANGDTCVSDADCTSGACSPHAPDTGGACVSPFADLCAGQLP
jgi:hypothetical protein